MINKIAGLIAFGLAMGSNVAFAELRNAELGLASHGLSGDNGDVATGILFGSVDFGLATELGVQTAIQFAHSEDQNYYYEEDTTSALAFAYSDFGIGRVGALLGRAKSESSDMALTAYGLGLQSGQSGDTLHSSFVLALGDFDDVSDETIVLSAMSIAAAVSDRFAITGELSNTSAELEGYDIRYTDYSIGMEFHATPRIQLTASLGGNHADDGDFTTDDATALLGVSYMFGNDLGARRQRNLTSMNFGL